MWNSKIYLINNNKITLITNNKNTKPILKYKGIFIKLLGISYKYIYKEKEHIISISIGYTNNIDIRLPNNIELIKIKGTNAAFILRSREDIRGYVNKIREINKERIYIENI